jgi:hypothetical protein
LDGSIKAYEQAGVHCKEVPRMLWEKKEKARLEECDAPRRAAPPPPLPPFPPPRSVAVLPPAVGAGTASPAATRSSPSGGRSTARA